MDILEHLKKEHEQVKQLVNQMCGTQDSKTRTDLFKEFKKALTRHSRAEEKVLYKRLIKSGDSAAEMGHEGFIEHGLADHLIAKLGRARDKSSEEWTAGIKVLKTVLEHHIAEEEKQIFPAVRREFDSSQRERMEQEFETAESKVRVAA